MLTKIARLTNRSSLDFCSAKRATLSKRFARSCNARLLSSGSDSNDFPKSAEIVIAGAGAIGSSVAYHLSQFGHKDVVVLEQGSLGCGTSWHSVGLIARLRSNALQSNLSKYASQLYSDLEKETGYDTGFKKCGSILVAKTKDRATSLRRIADKSRQFGTPCEELSLKDAQDLYPIMKIDDLQMALWSPEDGVVNASDVCQSLMKGATQKGVKFFEGVGVKTVATNGKQVTGVDTDRGFIHCDKFINCGGLWARELGLRTDPPLNIPLHSCEHFYIVTKPLEGVHGMLPSFRDYDSYLYIREWSGGIMAGGFEPVAKPLFYESGVPEKFEFQLLQEDWDQFDIIMQGLLNRVPIVETAEIRQFVNGPESFTPDGKFMFGEMAEIGNYYVAAGMNSNGIMCAAGMGKLTAELITHGSCSLDTSIIDVKRFSKESNNKLFLRDRVKTVLGNHYAMDYPRNVLKSARPLKCSPLYDLWKERGAVWNDVAGWEIASYFSEDKQSFPLTFGKPGWLSCTETEYNACKEAIGLADLSWQSKFEITSKHEENLIEELQYIFAENVDLPIGHFVTSALLTENGKYKGLANIHRLSKDKFLLVTSPLQHNHILFWLKKQMKSPESLQVKDVTTRYSSLAILGPYSQQVLAELTRTSLETTDFDVGQSKIVDLGYASDVILSRGCIGSSSDNWQAFVPSELVRGLVKLIVGSNIAPYTQLVGQYALDALRIESAIPEYGLEIGPLTSPAEMNDVTFVDLTKTQPFIGKEAVKKALENNSKSLMKLCIDEVDDDNWASGGEPVYVDGSNVGSLSSVSYCFKTNKVIAFGVLDKEAAQLGQLVVRIASKDYPASLVDAKA